MRQRLRGEDPGNLQKFLRSIDDPDTFADLAAFNLCDSPRLKQRLLETLDVSKRLGLLKTWAKTEVETLRITKTLQGELPDDNVSNN
jgi:ATP-dependent Lon protease